MTEHLVRRRTYLAIFGALLALTALTTFVAFFDLGALNPAVAMTIAVVKATLVVLFFMHLRHSDHVTWIVAGAAVFWLLILFVLILSDYLWRGPAIPGLG
jgi:cytochrome c oxidase subunit IV